MSGKIGAALASARHLFRDPPPPPDVTADQCDEILREAIGRIATAPEASMNFSFEWRAPRGVVWGDDFWSGLIGHEVRHDGRRVGKVTDCVRLDPERLLVSVEAPGLDMSDIPGADGHWELSVSAGAGGRAVES